MFESLARLAVPASAGPPPDLAAIAALMTLSAALLPVVLYLRSRRAAGRVRAALRLMAGLIACGWVALALQPPPRTEAESGRAVGAGLIAWVAGLAAARCAPGVLLAAGRAERPEDLERLRLLEAAVTASEDGVLITAPGDAGRPGFRIEYTNPAFERMTGYSEAEAVGQSPSILRTPEDEWEAFAAVRTALASDVAARIEVPSRRKDGGLMWAEWHVVPVPAAGGHSDRRVAVLRDTTERRQAQDEVRRARDFLTALLENIPVPVAVADEGNRFESVNPAWERATSVPRDRAIGRTPAELLPPAVAESVSAQNVGVRSGGRPLRGDRAVGERIYLTVGFPLPEPDGSVRRVGEVAVDLTHQKRAEAALRASEELSRGIITHIPCGVFWKDRGGVFLGCNDQFARDHGLGSPAEIVGRTEPDLLFIPTEAEENVACERRVIEMGQPILNREEIRARGGQRVSLLVSMVPLRGEGGQVCGVLGVYQDVTGLKRLEEQYRQAQKMEAVGRLAGGVAHDFNNLLTIINGNAELLRDLPPGDPAGMALADEIRGAGDRAAVLVRQLLTFSRRQPVRPEVLDVNEVLGGLSGLLRRLVGERVALVVRPAPGPALTRIDRGHLEQVVVNLAVNARDAMPTGGTLTVAVAADPPDAGPARRVRLSAADTGCGMTEEVRGRIFEPFFTTKGPDKGTGLGLATVFGIVEQAGGGIGVESAPGAGATFRVELPWVEGVPAARSGAITMAQTVSRSQAGYRVSVLLVEDEPAVRRLARHTLEAQGYSVTEAADGEAALAKLLPGRPVDLLVTDLRMPGIDGVELARRVRAARPEVGVVLTSGQPPDDLRRRLGSGWYYLPKPYQPGDLLRAAGKALAGQTGHDLTVAREMSEMSVT